MSGYMELSLRETEHVVRKWLFVLRSKEAPKQRAVYMFEGTLAIFILLRIKNRGMCERFFNEECKPPKIMNYLLGFLPWEGINGDGYEYDKCKNCIMSIVSACYFFFTEKEC